MRRLLVLIKKQLPCLGLLFAPMLLFQGCIGDDIIFDTVEEVVRITNSVDTLGLDDSYAFQAIYLNNIGQEEAANVIWSSSDTAVLSIDNTGLAFGKAPGDAVVEAAVETSGQEVIKDEVLVHVAEGETSTGSTERSGTIQTTSSYTLEGDFTLKQEGTGLVLSFGSDYRASSSLPGLYVYLTNNPNSTNNALEISKVSVFSGSHAYNIPILDLNAYQYVLYYCKPFNVKVGHGEIME